MTQANIDDASRHFGRRGVVKLIACCSMATSVAMLLNVRQMALPEGEKAPF